MFAVNQLLLYVFYTSIINRQFFQMRYLPFLIVIIIFSCQMADNTQETNEDSTSNSLDSLTIDTIDSKPDESVELTTFSNERFKDVTAKPLGDNKFLIEGKAQIFEANFGWVIEDGHNELKQGNEMTDAGAPDWGNFSFTVEATKIRQNSTLLLILFESSAKDGSRQYQLPIFLY